MSFVKNRKLFISALFGAIHGCIGILDQGFAVRTVFRENADADTASNAKGVTLNDEFGGNCIHEPLSRNCCVGDVLHGSQHDEEFVSTDSGYCVLFTRPCLQPLCNLLQKQGRRPSARASR